MKAILRKDSNYNRNLVVIIDSEQEVKKLYQNLLICNIYEEDGTQIRTPINTELILGHSLDLRDPPVYDEIITRIPRFLPFPNCEKVLLLINYKEYKIIENNKGVEDRIIRDT